MQDRIPNDEAAKFLGVSENTLNVWRCNGRYHIPYIKVGTRVWYWRKDLEAFLEARTVRN